MIDVVLFVAVYFGIFGLLTLACLFLDTDPDINYDGFARNLVVVASQWDDYIAEINTVIKPGIEEASGIGDKLHKVSAYGEEFFDKMPRLCWYTSLYGSVVNMVLIVYNYL